MSIGGALVKHVAMLVLKPDVFLVATAPFLRTAMSVFVHDA